MRPHDSLWDGAHDARLTGDVVDEILGGKVDRADWSVAPDDPGTGARPRHKLSLPYPAFSSCPFAQVDEDDATRICCVTAQMTKPATTSMRAFAIRKARRYQKRDGKWLTDEAIDDILETIEEFTGLRYSGQSLINWVTA